MNDSRHRVSLLQEIEKVFPELKLAGNEKIKRWWLSHYDYLLSLAQYYLPDQSRILEIGAGYAILAGLLSEISGELWVTEHPSREYFWKEEYLNLFRKRKVYVVAQDLIDGLPFKSEVFNAVFFCDVIEHLPIHLIPQIIEEIKRVLKPNGLLVLSTPNLCRLELRLKLLLGYSPNPPLFQPIYGKTYGHLREYSLEEVQTLIRPYFKIIKFSFRLLPVFSTRLLKRQWYIVWRFFNICKRIFPGMRDEIYVVAQKIG
ncbi:bifunctional 2-polyprenyl-6-hydroxyphenol methylase/3-demethylubiquinol 3-O-methyltransferase UbiG [Thermosulfurimonas sp. F29]|uniref:class I SAM-dependent methyltransferase n=1 Tax=Thermosulfurimonas sp. F29 TaxID=2867247 RepID=UPI001C83F009|nr:class I SAM-dependent methyltransferase [Thermosulfurimonas sp. F29]MBX6424246.1 class I SAM-dependent methyltransferase [Thermosulfurimonas sp. F29]